MSGATGHGSHEGHAEGEHRSRWPIVAVTGATLLYGDVAEVGLARATGLVLILPAVAGLGAVVVVVGLFAGSTRRSS